MFKISIGFTAVNVSLFLVQANNVLITQHTLFNGGKTGKQNDRKVNIASYNSRGTPSCAKTPLFECMYQNTFLTHNVGLRSLELLKTWFPVTFDWIRIYQLRKISAFYALNKLLILFFCSENPRSWKLISTNV